MARPTIFTKIVLQKLERAFAMDCTDEEACIYANIAPSSLYNHQKDNPEFLERKQLLRQKPILKARQTIIKALENPNYALKYLERKRRQEFGSEDIKVKIEPLPALSKEQQETLNRLLLKVYGPEPEAPKPEVALTKEN